MHYDFLVIGGGSAGFNAARVAADQGRKVAVVDSAKDLGGLCILRGCMPSKTLLWSAELLHQAKKSARFGLRIPKAEVDMKALHARKRELIGDFAGYRQKQLQSGRYALYRSHARFVDPHTVELDDGGKLTAKHFLIATGSRVSVPPIPGLAETPFWTSDDVLELSTRPESVIVLGGGVVACELTQFLARVGTKVTQIQRSPRLLKECSPEAAEIVAKSFVADGVRLFAGTKIVKVSGRPGAYSVTFESLSDKKKRTVRAERLLNALGREPLTEGLGLEKAGVKCAENGRILVNDWQQTSQPHIYAGGDVCGPHEIVHLAVAQGELSARHSARVKGLWPVASMPLLSVVFTSPAVASVGVGEAELKEAGVAYESASYPFDDHGKSIILDELRGYVKILAAKKDGRILGAEIVGPEAGELIHCFAAPITMKATVFDLLRSPWYHPTLAEILTYPAEELYEKCGKKRGRP